MIDSWALKCDWATEHEPNWHCLQMIRCVTNGHESVFSLRDTKTNTNTEASFNGWWVMTSFWRGQRPVSLLCFGECRLMRGGREMRGTMTMTRPWRAARAGWQKEALKRTDVKSSNMKNQQKHDAFSKARVQRRPKERRSSARMMNSGPPCMQALRPESLWKAFWKAAALKWTHSARLVLVLFARRLPAFHTSRNVSLR